MKYRSALVIHFKPGKSRIAIPLLSDLWNGEGTIMRRVGKETALFTIYKDFETLEEMKSSGSKGNTKIAEQLDPMIIDGSVTHHVWQHMLNDVHHSKVRRVFGMTFQNPLAFKEVEKAIEENAKFAQEKGKKITFWRKLFESPGGPKFIVSHDFDSLDEYAEDTPLPELKNHHMLIGSRVAHAEESVWMKVE